MSARVYTLALCAVALAACTKARTEAVVVVTTDGVRIPDDVDSITLTVADTTDLANPVFQKSFRVCGSDVSSDCLTLPLDFTLVPGPHRDHSSRVQVTATRNGAPEIDDAAVFTFAEGVSLRLDFVLFANCLGNVSCATLDQACGSDATCQPVPATPLHGEPDLGAGGGDLAGAPADLAFTPADMATGDMATSASDLATPTSDMATSASDLAIPTGDMAGTTNTGGADQVLSWTKASFDSGIFNGVWGLSGGTVYAVGNFASGGSTIWRNTNPAANPLAFVADTSYSSMTSLNAIAGRSLTDIYAVGPSGTVIHYDGSTWSDAGAGLGTTLGVNGIWVGGPNDDAWAVAGNLMTPGSDSYGYSHHNSALYPSGTHWNASTGIGHVFQSAWGDGNGFVVMVADESAVSYTPNNGGFLPTTLSTSTNPLYGVFGFSPTQLWAVGGNGAIWAMSYKASTMQFGSSLQTNLVPTTTAIFRAISGTTGDLWAVGDSNNVYHSTGDGTWTRQTNLPTPDGFTTFHGVLALGAHDVYVVGSIQGGKVIIHGK